MVAIDGMTMKFDNEKMKSIHGDYRPTICVSFSKGVRLRIWLAKLVFRFGAWLAWHDLQVEFSHGEKPGEGE